MANSKSCRYCIFIFSKWIFHILIIRKKLLSIRAGMERLLSQWRWQKKNVNSTNIMMSWQMLNWSERSRRVATDKDIIFTQPNLILILLFNFIFGLFITSMKWIVITRKMLFDGFVTLAATQIRFQIRIENRATCTTFFKFQIPNSN